MDHVSEITLMERASIAVVSCLWNQHNIISDISSFLLGTQNCKSWMNIENTVISHLRKIELPDVLEIKLNNLVQPMGMQMFKWISLTQSTFQAYPHPLDVFHFKFNERGILDGSKTAEQIIHSSPHKTLCFCLACIFCIEESILKIWPDVKLSLTSKIKNNISSVESVAVIYWVYYLNSEIEQLMTLTEYCGMKNAYEFGFLFMLDLRCLPSLNYFLKYIQPERKQRLIFLALQNIFHTGRPRDGNLVIFLFRHLSESDSNIIISENCYSVLASLLEWPSQEYFMQVMKHSVWNTLSNLEYLNLLQDMVELVSRYHVGYTYKNLTIQFWKSTPPSFKDYVKNKCISGTFLSRLFLYENTNDIIQMILNDFSEDEKQHMIFYFEGMNICDLLVKKERWDSLRLLIKNCIPNQSVLEEFIEEYENYKPYYFNEEMKERTQIMISKIKEWY